MASCRGAVCRVALVVTGLVFGVTAVAGAEAWTGRGSASDARAPARVAQAMPPAGTAAPEEAAPPSELLVLPPLVVTSPPPVAASSETLIPGKDFELLPQGRPADVLRLIPGLVIGQHQGGGKAEQYFLRGFDADHGTDIALFVDGVPVNLRSHAHGQGYADLHFLIPETVRLVEGFKGPYFPELGDFNTAGALRFLLEDVVDENVVTGAIGSFDTQRAVALLSPTRGAVKSLLALEYYHSDGPFESPNRYHRFNVLGKAGGAVAEDLTLSAWASYYYAEWFASGEIPLRAVERGLIGRFGAIDPTEGGDTRRANLSLDLTWRPADNQRLTVNAYASYYDLDQFNNFTLFLDDPILGDQINQRDRRALAGLDLRYEHRSAPLGLSLTSTGGVQYRIDTPHVVLAHSVRRRVLSVTQDVDVVEQSWSPFVTFDLVPVDKVRLVTGARGDIFTFDVRENVNTTGTDLHGTETRARPNVKANLILGPWADTEVFANFGTGFHSNDARAVVADPRLEALPTALGYEVGVRTKILPRVDVSATYWVLELDSELVFVGDEGTTEPRGASRREGIELATRIGILDWLTFHGNFTYTYHAEFDTGEAIPLAPRWTAFAELTARTPWGLNASLQMRHLGDRPASEDRTAVASGHTLVDLVARYRWRSAEAFFSIENLLDRDYRETQFFFTSRLPGEPPEGVADIHFVPGNPRTFLGGLAFYF
jgi:outer membrane receptor for monomeric catechols